MGAVYQADREEGDFRRTVAVKLVRGGPDADALARRFLQERRILARLEHPRIARMYDGGVTSRGDPFVVMEFVDGRPIDEYCTEMGLSIDERIGLFDQVCEAVEYAHRRLIVHRDLKPNNILVEAGGDVKLLDFGVAKLLDLPADETGTVTRPGRPVLTPEYASPEQLRGEPVSTACDVYALGVLLYELLTGMRPYSFSSRSPFEIEQVIRAQEPRRPSIAVTDPAASRTAPLPHADDAPPSDRDGLERIRKRLSGDLDNIVLTALRQEPDRRYPSVAALREDLRRHQAGFPVSARPQTLAYRASKFVRRHRGAVAAAALVAIATLAGVTGTVWQARAAERQAERAERVTTLLADIFQASDPDAAAGRAPTARELLDRGAQRLERELGAEPDLHAELLAVVGGIYESLGEYQASRDLLTRSVELRRGLGRGSELGLATSLADLSSVLYELAEYEAAESAARESREIRSRLLGDDAVETARSVSNIASTLSARGLYDEAEPLFREVLAIDRAAGDTAEVATDLSNLGLLLQNMNRNDESREMLEEALRLRRGLYGGDHTLVAIAAHNLAETLKSQGDYEEADPLLREVVDMRVRLLGEDHPHVALALNNRGDLMTQTGRYEEAAELHVRALAIRRAALGEDHPDVAASLNNLAIVAYHRREYDAAAAAFIEARDVFARTRGETHPNTLTALNNLAAVYREQGRLAEAERMFRESLALQLETFGPTHFGTITATHNLAWTLFQADRFDEALPLFQQAADLFDETQGRHPNTGTALGGLGRTYLELDQPDLAEAPLREAASILAETQEPESVRTADLRIWLGVCLLRLGRPDEAEEPLTLGLESSRAARDADHPMTRRAEEALQELAGASNE
jgi:serine/threonine-protein kinase